MLKVNEMNATAMIGDFGPGYAGRDRHAQAL